MYVRWSRRGRSAEEEDSEHLALADVVVIKDVHSQEAPETRALPDSRRRDFTRTSLNVTCMTCGHLQKTMTQTN